MNQEDMNIYLDIGSRKVLGELRDIINSMKGFHIQDNLESGDCDILIKELGENPEEGYKLISSLMENGAVNNTFITSNVIEHEMLINALRIGVREYFPQPLKKEDVMNALLRVKNNNRDASQKAVRKKGKIINVIGAKGGIGTTTIAVNLAASILEIKKPSSTVAIVDMNLLFGEVPLFLDLDPVFNWGEAVKNIDRLDSTYMKNVLSKHGSGLYILPSPTGLDGGNSATPEIIEKILNIMRMEFDYVIIDSGHPVDHLSLKILEMSDTIMIVSILSLPCLINVKRLLDTFRRNMIVQNENILIVINRFHKNSVITPKEAEKGLQKQIFLTIPNDFQTTMSAINQGKTLSAISRKAEISQKLSDLSSRIIAGEKAPVEDKGLSGFRFSELKLQWQKQTGDMKYV